MANSSAQKPLTLDEIKARAKSMGIPARALFDMIYSGGRSAIATTAGLPADMANTAIGLHNMARDIRRRKFEGYEPGTIPGGSEDIKELIPDLTKDPKSNLNKMADFGGNFFVIPGMGKAALKGAEAIGEHAGHMVASGQRLIPGFPEPQMAMFAVKPKGGSWADIPLKKELDSLKAVPDAEERAKALKQAKDQIQDARNKGMEFSDETLTQADNAHKKAQNHVALNNWIDKNLGNYIKNEMGTPEDPVRKLAEQGIHHTDLAQLFVNHPVTSARLRAGMPSTGYATNPMAQRWENITDSVINPTTAGELMDKQTFKPHFENNSNSRENLMSKKDMDWYNNAIQKSLDANQDVATPAWSMEPGPMKDYPWLQKKSPSTPVSQINADKFRYLDFDHIIDILKADLDEGRLNPNTLKNVSVPQAVTRTHEANETARKLAEKQSEEELRNNLTNLKPEKEYESGHKWVKLPDSESSDDALKMVKTIGKQGGWCTQHDANALGYGGRSEGNELYALLDPKGRPHLQVQVSTPPIDQDAFEDLPGDQKAQMSQAVRSWRQRNPDVEELDDHHVNQALSEAGFKVPKNIEQMKPFSNNWESKMVNDQLEKDPDYINKYKPFLDDFVQSGDWGEVNDLKNTNLTEVKPNVHVQANGLGLKLPRFMPNHEHEALNNHILYNNVSDEANKAELPESLQKYKIPDEPQGLAEGGQPEHPGFLNPSLKLANGQVTLDPLEFMPNYDVGGTVKSLATPNNISRLTDLPYINDAVQAAQKGNYGDLIGSAVNAIMPTGMALATYSPDLNTNESSDLSKTQYVQGHYGRQPRTWNNGMARGGKVHVADDLDMMRHEVHMAKGGLNEIIPMLARVAAKKPEEIKAIAERMAPQVVGEKFVRGSSGNTSVAGKSQKQFQREKELPIDIRPDKELPKPEIVDLAKHKGKVMVGIAGDPTMSAHTLHSVGDVNLESPAPQHGGPFYGLDKDVFWASGLSQANNAQRVAREASQSYNAPVIGNYMKMGPDSYYYAQHLADANLQAIDPTKMTDAQKALLNADIRAGGPMSKNKPIPYFDTFENKGDAYMQMQMNPALRKHFNWLVMKPTSAEKYGIPSGLDIAHAITVPKLANLETGVTGASMGEMKPFDPLTLSSHPTYSHDIPGQFLGSSKYPIPYELMFPDSLETVKNNPIQAPQEFGSLKMIGPRQIIDQQMIDEIGQYQDAMKSLTGKKKGGKVNVSNDPDMMRHELKTRG